MHLLEKLYLNDNHISIFEGLNQNKRLHYVELSNQKTKKCLQFNE
jgi:hypothetical protein